MLDHIFLDVSEIERSIAFYERVLPILGITARLDYDGQDGPPGHPDLKASAPRDGCSSGCAQARLRPARYMSASSRIPKHGGRRLRPGPVGGRHRDPSTGPQLHYDPRYYAAQVRDLDGYSLEFVFKSWQHGS